MGNNKDLHWCFNPFRIDETTVYYKNFFFLVWGLAFPILVIFLLGLGSYLEGGPLKFEWHQEAYEYFYEFYRFPILILPAVGILGVTIARMHASKVRERSLRIAEAKNDFDRRFKHEEEFLIYLGKLEGSSPASPFTLKFLVRNIIYSIYFPRNTQSARELRLDEANFHSHMDTLNSLFSNQLNLWLGALAEDKDADVMIDTIIFGMKELFRHIEGYFGIECCVGDVNCRDLTDDQLVNLCDNPTLTWFHFDLANFVHSACCFMVDDTIGSSLLVMPKPASSRKLFDKMPHDMSRELQLKRLNTTSNN